MVLREVINTTLHIMLGFILCYAFLPKAESWVLILVVGGLGAVREHIQLLRGHKQEDWLKYWDTAGFIIGVLLFILARHLGLDADANY